MNFSQSNDQEKYYADADLWVTDTFAKVKRSRTRAWIFAGLMAFVAIISVASTLFMIGQNKVEPWLLTVEKVTGAYHVVRPQKPDEITDSEVLKASYVGQYVINRETYQREDINRLAKLVRQYSCGDALNGYNQQWRLESDRNPTVRYKDGADALIEINSIHPLNKTTTQVRFTRFIERNGVRSQSERFAAILTHGYVREGGSLASRIVNPLGFCVNTYRKDKEVFSREVN